MRSNVCEDLGRLQNAKFILPLEVCIPDVIECLRKHVLEGGNFNCGITIVQPPVDQTLCDPVIMPADMTRACAPLKKIYLLLDIQTVVDWIFLHQACRIFSAAIPSED